MADPRTEANSAAAANSALGAQQAAQAITAQGQQAAQAGLAANNQALSNSRFAAGQSAVNQQLSTGQAAINEWLKGGQANQMAGSQARMGAADVASQGTGNARAAGMNAAQAAQMGSQAGGNAYSGLYSNIFGSAYSTGANALNQSMATGASAQNQLTATGVNSATQNAATNAGMANAYGNQGAAYSTAATGSNTAAANAHVGLAQADAAEHAAQWSAAGSIIGGLLSDETQKTDIQPINQSDSGQNKNFLDTIKTEGKSNGNDGKVLRAVMAMSDEGQKKDIKTGKDVLDSILGKIKGYSFNYKEGNFAGEDPNQRHFGVMAQDIEQTPLKSAVINTPQGKMVDTKQMTMANTALLSQMNDKVNKLQKMMAQSWGKNLNTMNKDNPKSYKPNWEQMNGKAE